MAALAGNGSATPLWITIRDCGSYVLDWPPPVDEQKGGKYKELEIKVAPRLAMNLLVVIF
jgi:hypothetical protein